MTSRNEPMRGVMDAMSDYDVHTIVVMTSSQVGKTEVLLNAMGFFIDQDPSPILHLQPTLEMGEAFSKDRLRPMLRDTPALRGKVRDPRERDSGNTLLHKTFPGGHITIAGSNSPASLASRPVRVVLADEIDRYPFSAGLEGDPVSLARKRTQTFWNRKIILTSTPTIKGLSRIDAEFKTSDQRFYHVPCPDCGAFQVLVWKQVRWPPGQAHLAVYQCAHCDAEWDDLARWRQLRDGSWEASAPFHGIAGFHLNGITSPWVRLGDMAREFLEAKKSVETLKTWVNTSLGETFEEEAERVDAKGIAARLEAWGDEKTPSSQWTVPADVLVITCGVDVQDDRIEIERVGWGVDEESWSLDHRILYGDPTAPDLWKQLDDYLLTNSVRADHTVLPVHAVGVDSGHHTNAVYKFCQTRYGRRVYAIKGGAGAGRPVWPKRASKNNKVRVNLFVVGVDAAKDSVYSRTRITTVGPGYMHFPNDREMVYFEQLTAEEVHTRYKKGFPVREYSLPSGKRNEALDLRVYAYAVLMALNVRWGVIKALNERATGRVRKPLPAAPKSEDVSGVPAFEAVASPPQSPAAPSLRPPTLQQRPIVRTRGRIRRSAWMA